MILVNLFRDRLDCYGEVEAVGRAWERLDATSPASTVYVLNADDPIVAHLGRGSRAAVFYGLEDPAHGRPALEHASDAKSCRRCGAPYEYERAFLGHLGHYACPACGARRPVPDVAGTAVRLEGVTGSRVSIRTRAGDLDVRLPLPGLYNAYNALAATAAGLALGAPLGAVRRGLEAVRPIFGRAETIEVAGTAVSILLMKNPAGANELLRTLGRESPNGGFDLWIGLNDGTPDGRDVSWIWDADFETFAGRVRGVTCSGTRAAELGLRLKYAGWPEEAIAVDGDIGRSLDSAVARAAGRLFALPTYTALLELRTLLARRGLAPEYWA